MNTNEEIENTCMICYGDLCILHYAVLQNCHHKFCESCAGNFRTEGVKIICPIDRCLSGSITLYNGKFNEIIETSDAELFIKQAFIKSLPETVNNLHKLIKRLFIDLSIYQRNRKLYNEHMDLLEQNIFCLMNTNVVDEERGKIIAKLTELELIETEERQQLQQKPLSEYYFENLCEIENQFCRFPLERSLFKQNEFENYKIARKSLQLSNILKIMFTNDFNNLQTKIPLDDVLQIINEDNCMRFSNMKSLSRIRAIQNGQFRKIFLYMKSIMLSICTFEKDEYISTIFGEEQFGTCLLCCDIVEDERSIKFTECNHFICSNCAGDWDVKNIVCPFDGQLIDTCELTKHKNKLSKTIENSEGSFEMMVNFLEYLKANYEVIRYAYNLRMEIEGVSDENLPNVLNGYSCPTINVVKQDHEMEWPFTESYEYITAKTFSNVGKFFKFHNLNQLIITAFIHLESTKHFATQIVNHMLGGKNRPGNIDYEFMKKKTDLFLISLDLSIENIEQSWNSIRQMSYNRLCMVIYEIIVKLNNL